MTGETIYEIAGAIAPTFGTAMSCSNSPQESGTPASTPPRSSARAAGPIALALRRLLEADRAEVRSQVEDSLGRFTLGHGYELPGVALCAVAS